MSNSSLTSAELSAFQSLTVTNYKFNELFLHWKANAEGWRSWSDKQRMEIERQKVEIERQMAEIQQLRRDNAQLHCIIQTKDKEAAESNSKKDEYIRSLEYELRFIEGSGTYSSIYSPFLQQSSSSDATSTDPLISRPGESVYRTREHVSELDSGAVVPASKRQRTGSIEAPTE